MNASAFAKIPYGMFIITSAFDGKIGGQTANTVFQITSNPATIAVSISKQNNTHLLLDKSRKAVISCLTEEAPFEFIAKFGFRSSKNFDKFSGINFTKNADGIPVIETYANAYFETEIISTMDADTHTLFLCKTVNAVLLNDKPTMTYDYYHKVKKGLTPKNAPTYIEKQRI
ncbi:MAG: flavin reductase family protein [Endomicrobiaceae bacterium]|nr:flavin reductase family protein [Endomicrobiaceae bacterium]